MMVRLLKKNIPPINIIPEVTKVFRLNPIPIIEISPPNIGRYQNLLGYNKLVIIMTNKRHVKIAFKRNALSLIMLFIRSIT
ncbi:MAG: hypothetical protein KGY66_05105 [Candidatus Thermoplasmatota archaeon]|nr:hypothetical protein [Candidatus Thermoplasmatota archaeon]